MAGYRDYDYSQMIMVPVSLEEQLQPGTLEYAIHNVVEQGLDLSIFAASCQVHVFYGKRPGSLTDEMKQKSVHLEGGISRSAFSGCFIAWFTILKRS